MNIPISWFKRYVDFQCSTEDFGEALTMSGTKVEAIEYKNKELEKIVVGKIIKIEQHPDADKLVVCQVDIGTEKIQIVTGANNIKENDLIPVVLVGGVVSGNNKIKKGKLRGVESFGMMCSIEELGYTTTEYPEAPENGIYIFKEDIELGTDVCELLQLKDEIIEFEITSNRPDCYSFIGLMREAKAIFDTSCKKISTLVREDCKENINDFIKVKIETENCKRYACRVVKNLKIEPSPLWLRHRLACAGIRPVNNIVDITNYVLVEYGQPMHAFDLNCVNNGEIIVRQAKENEKIVTLDGVERELTPDIMLISDDQKNLAIAGIMGGENSKITDNAEYVLLECASFDGTNVRLSSKKLGHRTDSSGKFEKGLDPNLVEEALERCAHLVEELGVGEIVSGVVDVYPNPITPNKMEYSPEKINKLLGTNISEANMVKILTSLEIEVEGRILTIPTFRRDIISNADITEEICRINGYDKVPVTLPKTVTIGKLNSKQNLEKITKDTMISMGYYEALVYSFESPKVYEKLNIAENSKLREAIKINNPLGEDFSIMRTQTENSMLISLGNNYNRKNKDVRLFELGNIYLADTLPITDLAYEKEVLTLGAYDCDFFDVKGAVETYFDTVGLKAEFLPTNKHEIYHPLRKAEIICGNDIVGYIGEVHPKVSKNYGINTKTYISVLYLDIIEIHSELKRKYKEVPKYPAIEFDLAIVVDANKYAIDVEKAIIEKGGKNLEDVKLFDVYQGSNIDDDKKSIAFKLTFRDANRTLEYNEVKEVVERILKNVENKTGGILRK
ncbi:MAG: phenylalanine--tRNA ligase subunit beta [Lachnospirales bacterium]